MQDMLIPFPDKKYSVIYADPPWKYHDVHIGSGSKINVPYSTMTMKEISALPVQDISEEDCLLFMWVISPDLPNCIKVGEAWGFKFSTVAFNWDKQLPNPGFYTLSQTELCLVFKRGKIPKPRGKRNTRQFLSVKRGKHSTKPYEVRDMIIEMFPHHERIELFARERFDGWDAWGNEL